MEKFKILFKNKIFLVMVLLVVLMFPTAILQSQETQNRSVITMVGVDKISEQVEVTICFVVPKSGTQQQGENLRVLSAKGENTVTALQTLGLNIGKDIGLAHCQTIILGAELCEEDVTKYLDYFLRSYNLSTNATVVSAAGTAKEVMEASIKDLKEFSFTLNDIIDYNDSHFFNGNQTVEELYKNHFSQSQVSFLDIVETNSPSSSSGGEGEGKAEKQLKNNGLLRLMKNGKKVRDLTQQEIFAYTALHTKGQKGLLTINNVTTKHLNNATLTFEFIEKNINKQAYFFQGIPILKVEAELTLLAVEINDSQTDLNNIDIASNWFTEEVKEKIKERIEEDYALAVQLAKDYKTDTMQVYKLFYSFKNAEWKDFVNSLEDKEDYLRYVVFETEIKIKLQS